MYRNNNPCLPRDLSFGDIFVDVMNIHRDEGQPRAVAAEDRASIRRICGLMNQDRCCYSSILNFRGLLALNSRAPSLYRSFDNSYVSKIYRNLRKKNEKAHTEGWILCSVRFVVSSAALAPTQTALLTKCACAAEPSGLCNNEIWVNDNSW